MDEEIRELQAAIGELFEALNLYGNHLPHCIIKENCCSCGFLEFIKKWDDIIEE